MGVANLLFHMRVRIYLNVKIPCVGHRFLISPPDMARVLPIRGVLGHYIDRYIKTWYEYPQIILLHSQRNLESVHCPLLSGMIVKQVKGTIVFQIFLWWLSTGDRRPLL